MREKLLEICDRWDIELTEQVPLASHTTFHIGGAADYWAEISSEQGLAQLVQFCRETGMPYFVMGRGSNILAADEGFRGIILHIGSRFSNMEWKTPHTLKCEAGAMLIRAAKSAEEHGQTGMEGLSGIPGSIGGALFMNAGAYGYEMSQIVSSCTYLDPKGEIHMRKASQLDLGHRHSWFMDHPDCIILTVTMQLEAGDPAEITAQMQDFLQRRSDKQPLDLPSAGSTFKRPAGSYASKLIDECGLKGLTVGGAQVSEKHAGFVVNTGDATAADVLALCREVRDRVKKETGYVLEMEPVLLGDIELGA